MKHHQRFDNWVKDSFLTNQAVADRLNAASDDLVSNESVRLWRAGKVKPRLNIRPLIENISKGKVSAKGW